VLVLHVQSIRDARFKKILRYLFVIVTNCFFWYMPQYIWEVFKH